MNLKNIPVCSKSIKTPKPQNPISRNLKYWNDLWNKLLINWVHLNLIEMEQALTHRSSYLPPPKIKTDEEESKFDFELK